MKSIKTLPEFAQLSELDIKAALDAYDAAVENAGDDDSLAEGNPIAQEFFRLVNAYTERLDEIIRDAKKTQAELSESFLADLFAYEPSTAMERTAFDFVTGIFLDIDDGEE